MNAEELGKLVEDAASALGEQFEAVQIVASNSEGDGTRCIKRGVGNFYARLGMCREFVEQDSGEVLGSKIADALNDEEGDD